jgi:hypothetical protein
MVAKAKAKAFMSIWDSRIGISLPIRQCAKGDQFNHQAP